MARADVPALENKRGNQAYTPSPESSLRGKVLTYLARPEMAWRFGAHAGRCTAWGITTAPSNSHSFLGLPDNKETNKFSD